MSNTRFNPSKRKFIKSSLIGGISLISIPSLISCNGEPLSYGLGLDVPTKYFDGSRCWCHPRAGIIPDAGSGGLPRVVMTMNNLDLAGSDVFYGV
ncbi:MAG: exo-alpha-sialidase, partial [Cyclobacteriaceae bacterium]